MEKKVVVKIEKVSNDTITSIYAYNGDMGMDVIANKVSYDENTDTYIYYTGIKCETEVGVGCFACARSSISNKEAYLVNGIGVVDTATYRGEIQLRFKNRTNWSDRVLRAARENYMSLNPLQKIIYQLKHLRPHTVADLAEELNMKPENYAPYEYGERIGQLVFIDYLQADLEFVEKLSQTSRGEGGFGSTGN